MSGPDVEHAGWAVGGPGSRLRRRRNPFLGLIALVLLVGGIGAAGYGIVRLALEVGPAGERVLARGTIAGLDGAPAPPAEFSAAAAGPVTVWLRAGGPDNVRSSIAAGTECDLTRPDGSAARIRGSRQGTAVSVQNHETIGGFEVAQGRNSVSCRHVPFGGWRNRGRLREQRAFVVERGSPGDGLGGMLLLFPGVAAVLAGVLVGMRWRRGSLKPA